LKIAQVIADATRRSLGLDCQEVAEKEAIKLLQMVFA
jgi:hypothetical protein